MPRRPRSSIYSPRYWPTWLGLGLLRLNARLNTYGGTLALGAAAGRLAMRLMPRRRRIAEVNIALCFPERTAPERQALVQAHFEALGAGLLLLGFSWWARDDKLSTLVECEGLEHIERALEAGRGAILLGMHFVDLDIFGRLLGQRVRFAVVYRRHGNPVMEHFLRRQRERHFLAAIPRGDIRGLLRALKANMPVWYATDQATRGRHSALVPFFGVPAATNTGTTRLAKASGAPVIPCFGYRLPGKRGWRVVVNPPLEAFPGDDPVADTARINREIEAAVRAAPAQYLWIHRRFKKRDGMESPY